MTLSLYIYYTLLKEWYDFIMPLINFKCNGNWNKLKPTK